MEDSIQQEVISVKKYGNRRYYSSYHSRFLTLEEIAELVRKGRKVLVFDAQTEEDITREVLTQILLEQGRAQHFPVEMLEQMIRLNEATLKDFWQAYLGQSMKMFSTMQKEMEHFYQNLNPLMSFWKGGVRQPGRNSAEEAPRESVEKVAKPKGAARRPPRTKI